MKYSQKELLFIVNCIDKQSYELNAWEKRFVSNIKDLVEHEIQLSASQAEKLSEIWDRLS